MKIDIVPRIISTTGLLFILISISSAVEEKFVELARFQATEARQGIAVDENFIYVIGTREIGKYDKKTFKLLAHWEEKENGPIIHLDSGVTVDGKLYCAHSNYPGIPMTSSIEIWNPETLEHIDSFSFGIHWGSCTWIDYYDGYWWASFAHYDKWKIQTNKGTEWTTVIKFNEQWQFLQAWVFPEEIVQRFRPMSNSGGSWGADGLLYCTGHDLPELYVIKLPPAGSILELKKIMPIDNLGQGIAWDRNNPGIIYTIRKKDREVVIFKLMEKE